MIEIILLAAVILFTYGLMLTFDGYRTDHRAEQSRSDNRLYLPEDAVLRRHFISQIRYEIEACLPPPPTDSILRRHYESMVSTELAGRLAALKPLRSY